MKILHVIDSLRPERGGPPRSALRLAAAQASQGHTVGILSHHPEEQLELLHDVLGQLPGASAVGLEFLPTPGLVEHLFAAVARRRLDSLVPACDVVHLHNLWDSVLRAAAASCRALGRPYFFQPNGMLHPWSLAQSRWKKRLALATVYRRLLDEATGCFVGNTLEEVHLASLGLRSPRFVVPQNGIFLEEIDALPPQGRFYTRCPALEGRPFGLFLGRLHPKKGLDILAEAFAAAAAWAPQLQLVAVGHDEGARGDFERRIARHGLSRRVHLVGPQHGPAKWEAFRDALCFVLPSHQEASSIAITEALACGLPVLISEACEFPEVAEAGAGEVLPLDPKRFAEALVRIQGDPGRRARMSQRARELVTSRFQCSYIAERAVSAYRDAGKAERRAH